MQKTKKRIGREAGSGDTYLLNDLASESKSQAVVLQRELFNKARVRNAEPDFSSFFVATRDLHSELHYGFISNVEYSDLAKMVAQNSKVDLNSVDVIENFRDQFIGGFEEKGFLRTLCDALLSLEDPAGTMLIYTISIEGKKQWFSTFDQDGTQSDSIAEQVKGILGELTVTENLHGTLKQFRKCVGGTRFDGRYRVAVRIDSSSEKGDLMRRRNPSLVQFALVYEQDPEEEEQSSILSIRCLQQWMDSSSIATYSVLYERERYFSKALRQSAQGRIIKWGDKDGVNSQIKFLKDLSDRHTHAAPVLLDYERGSQDSKVSWYTMPKYAMPRMLDIMVSTEDLSKYETISLARACFSHLHDFFWQNVVGEGTKDGGKYGFKPSLLAAMVVSLESVEDAQEAIQARWGKHDEGIPILIDDRLVADSRINSKSCIKEFLVEEKQLSVTLKLNPRKKGVKICLTSVREQLLSIIKTIKRQSVERSTVPLRISHKTEGKLHGDPHFENLFIDASIPEDPFIVAIDPNVPGYEWNEKKGRINKWKDGALLKHTRKRFGESYEDPAHDIAKMLLSTTGMYSLVSRDAYTLSENGRRAEIRWNDREESRRLVDGGVSGARIVALAARAAESSLSNHVIFARTVIDAYIEKIANVAEQQKADINLNINVALIRVWTMLLRHTFSISKKLFPEQAERALIHYVIGAYLAKEGCDLLRIDLKSAILSPKFTDEIRDILVLQKFMS